MGVLLAVVGEQAGVIGPQMFVAILFASIASALVVGPALSFSLRRRQASNVLAFFSRRGILAEISARTRYEAIDELVGCAAEVNPRFDRAELAAAVRAREETMGTGVGEGIAVPHARVDGMLRPTVVFGVSKGGIDWDAIDDRPAHLLFLVLTPADDQDSQLEILSSIARGIDAREFDALLHCRNAGEIWNRLQTTLTKDRSAR